MNLRNKAIDLAKKIIPSVFVFISKVVGNDKFLGAVALACERNGFFYTFHVRPKYVEQIETFSDDVLKKIPLQAIVLQGPVIHKDNFTLETILLYKKHFKDAIVILSTWEGEDLSAIAEIEHSEVYVILSKKPNNPGISNINFQIESSRRGIEKARQLGAHYILKTRTDQRMYAPNALYYLFSLVKSYKLSLNVHLQKERLVGVSLNTFKYRMYGLSDMFLYGNAQDISNFWRVNFDERAAVDTENLSLREYAQERLCEVYLMTNYLKLINHNIQWNLNDSFAAFSNYFYIIDKEAIDLFWPKYSRNEYRWLSYSCSRLKFQELTNRDWTILSNDSCRLSIPDSRLDELK